MERVKKGSRRQRSLNHTFLSLSTLLFISTACNPIAKTQIGAEFYPGVEFSISESRLTTTNSQVASGSSVDVTLYLRDSNGVAFVSNRPVVTFSAEGGTSFGNLGAVRNNHNGSYTTSFTGIVSGTPTTLHAQVDGKEITSKVPTLQVTSGNFSLSNSVISVSSNTVASGSSLTVTLTARDGANNPLNDGGLSVAFSASGGTSAGSFGSVSDNHDGTYQATFTGLVSGTATNIRATISGNPVTSSAPTVIVTGGSANSIAVSSGDAQSGTVGSTLSSAFVAIVKDANNNPLSGLTIDWAISAGGGSLSSTSNPSNASGLSSSTLTLGTATGSNTVTATIHGTGLSTSFNATKTVGALDNYLLSDVPATATAGNSFTFTVTARDQYNNTKTNDTSTLHFTSSDPNSPTLPSDYVLVGTDAGVKQFSATLKTSGNQTITVAKTPGASPTSTSSNISVSANTATQIAIITGPANTVAGEDLPTMVVRALDAYANTATGYGGDISLAILNNAGGGTLSGTSTVSANSGSASFPGLSINKTGNAYTLRASGTGGVGTFDSGTFNITASTPTSIVVSSGNSQTSLISTSLASPLVALLTDAYGNLVPSASVTWSATSGGGSVASCAGASSITSNASGTVSCVPQLGGVAGANTFSATASGVGIPATFSATATNPTVTIASPASGSNINAANKTAFSISGSCTENGRSVNVTLSDGTTTVTPTAPTCDTGSSPNWILSIDAHTLADGVANGILASVSQTDVVGNVSPTITRNFTKDATVPTLAFITPTGSSFVTIANKAAFSVTGSCSENGRSVSISATDSSTTVTATPTCNTGSSPNFSSVLDLSTLADGVITFSASQSDLAGNTGSASPVTPLKDSVAPTIAITTPSAGIYANAANYTSLSMQGSCSENTRSVSLSATDGTHTASASATCSTGSSPNWSGSINLASLDEGAVTLSASLADAAGNSTTASSVSIIKKATPPTVAVSKVHGATTDSTQDDFTSGTLAGVAYSSGKLGLSTTTNNSELDASWTPQWTNIVGYWGFDGSGSVSHAASVPAIRGVAGTAENANASGLSYSSSAQIKQGLALDGSDDAVNFGNQASYNFGTSSFTLMTWIQPGNGNNSRYLDKGYYGGPGYSLHQGWAGGTLGVSINFAVKSSDGQNMVIALNRNALGVGTDNKMHLIVAVMDRTGHRARLYVDGKLQTIERHWTGDIGTLVDGDTALDISGFTGNVDNPNALTAGRVEWYGTSYDYFTGTMDEVALWNTALTAQEIQTIYSRQSAKYSGTFTSRVMDAGASKSWTNFSWLPTLPFFKELPDSIDNTVRSETSTDYSSLVGSDGTTATQDLMAGIAGLWHLNEASGTAGAASVLDHSGQDRHATPSGGVSFGTIGKLGTSATFDGSSGYLNLGPTFNFTASDFSISFWLKLNSMDTNVSGQGPVLFNVGGYQTAGYYSQVSADGTVSFTTNQPGANQTSLSAPGTLSAGQWRHVSFVRSGSSVRVYVNGLDATASAGTHLDPVNWGQNFYVGLYPGPNIVMSGHFDEVGIWSRALHANEVKQLYQRGASRLKFQVKSCASVDCSDNNTWKGYDGTNQTYLSELNNNTAPLAMTGEVNTTLPDMLLSAFTNPPSANRYFQYRSIFETDDSDIALGPQLKRVQVQASSYSTLPLNTITGTCSENGLNVSISVTDGTNTAIGTAVCSGGQYTAVIDLSSLADGALTVTSAQTDVAGNTTTTSGTASSKHATLPSNATSLAWSEASPATQATIHATWTRSSSSALENQQIQFYVDGTCTTKYGTPVSLGSASASSYAYAPSGGNTYTYTLTSRDSYGNTSTSGCSSSIYKVGSPASIAVHANNNQSATVGSTLGSALQVIVKDSNSYVVGSGVSVSWAASGGGGSVAACSGSTTNASGIASCTPTLGTTTGSNTFTASVAGVASPATFGASGTPDAPASIAVSANNNQSGTAGTAITGFTAVVKDTYTNIVPSVTVDWAVTGGGGSLSSSSNSTDTDGLSSSTLTLGPAPATNTVTATVHGTGLSTTFTATGTWDTDASSYFTRVTTANGGSDPISGGEKENINAFIVGLKALSAWDHIVEAWTLRSTQNVGSGVVVVGLKGVYDSDFVNSPTWSTEGVVVQNGYLNATISEEPSTYSTLATFQVYKTPTAFGNLDFGSGHPWFFYRNNWYGQNRSGVGYNNTASGWVSAAWYFATYNDSVAFQSSQTNYVIGSSSFHFRNGASDGWIAPELPPGASDAPIVGGTMTSLPYGYSASDASVTTFFLLGSGTLPNIHSLYKSTIGQGLGMP